LVYLFFPWKVGGGRDPHLISSLILAQNDLVR